MSRVRDLIMKSYTCRRNSRSNASKAHVSETSKYYTSAENILEIIAESFPLSLSIYIYVLARVPQQVNPYNKIIVLIVKITVPKRRSVQRATDIVEW